MFSFSLRIWIVNKGRLRNEGERFFFASSRWRCAANTDEPVNAEFLVKLLDIQHRTAINILKKQPVLSTFTCNRIAKAYALCTENGISSALILTRPYILTLRPFSLEQRILFYKEVGCLRILPNMISPFSMNAKLCVKDLKNCKILPANHNVVENIMKHVPGTPSDSPELKSLNDDCSVSLIHRSCVRQFLKFRLNFTDEQLDTRLNYPPLISFKAVTTFKKAIEMLETELGFSKSKIRKNIHLVSVNSFTIESLVKKLKEVGDVNFKALVLKHPRLLQLDVDLIQKKIDVLVKLGVPHSTIAKCPEILIFPTKTIEKRVEELKTIPELMSLWSHSRMLSLVFYLNRVKKRLRHLKELKIRCISLHTLTCDHMSYRRYTQDGCDRTKGKDLIEFLNYELDDLETIRATLPRHPSWCQIPYMRSYETFFYLKRRDFSNDDILRNIQIILYSSQQIDKELNKIDAGKMYQSREFTPSQKLALCLYNIEKEYHFNGHGVWNCLLNENTVCNNEEEQNPQSLRHIGKL